MTTAVSPETVLEIAKIAAGLGAPVIVFGILAWRSPLLAKEFFSFLRWLLTDYRKPTTKRGKTKDPQTLADPQGSQTSPSASSNSR
jgi:hypothetical protein